MLTISRMQLVVVGLMAVACFLVAVLAAGSIGFVLGKRAASRTPIPTASGQSLLPQELRASQPGSGKGRFSIVEWTKQRERNILSEYEGRRVEISGIFTHCSEVVGDPDFFILHLRCKEGTGYIWLARFSDPQLPKKIREGEQIIVSGIVARRFQNGDTRCAVDQCKIIY